MATSSARLKPWQRPPLTAVRHGVETKTLKAAAPLLLPRDAAYSEPVVSEAERAAGPVVEPFAGSAGRILGYVAAAVGLLLAGACAFNGVAANRVLLCFSVAIACISWVVMIRPAVSAREHGVLLQNMTRDIFVPWASIERARALQTLQVVTAGATYHGLGVTRSARSLLKDVRRGAGGASAFGGSAVFGGGFTPREQPLHQTGGSYQSYVEARLQDLASSRAKSTTGLRPRVSWAVLPVSATAVAAICVVLMFV
jgi:hypothetical protein